MGILNNMILKVNRFIGFTLFCGCLISTLLIICEFPGKLNHPKTPRRKMRIWNDFDLNGISEYCNFNFPPAKLCMMYDGLTVGTILEKNVYIMGERHSGTNLISTLLHQNFNVTIHDGLGAHKHVFQDTEGPFNAGVAVVSIRNPFDWVLGMKKQCWFCQSPEWDRNVSTWNLEDFVSVPWEGSFEGNEKFRNIFEMRYTKLCNHLQASLRATCVLLVRHDDLILPWQQVKFIHQIPSLLGWSLSTKAKYLSTYKWMEGEPYDSFAEISRSHQMTPLNQSAIEIVKNHMNATLEASLGYFALTDFM